jgi:hypothetical protein
MRLLLFLIRLLFKRLWEILRSAPGVFIVLGAIIVLFVALHLTGIFRIGIALDETQLLLVLGMSLFLSLGGAWFTAGTLQGAVFRLCNSRFSNRTLLRAIVMFRSLGYTVPLLVVLLLNCLGLIRTGTLTMLPPPLNNRYVLWGICLVFNLAAGFFLQYLGYFLYRGRRTPRTRLVLPRLKSLAADYAVDFVAEYLLLLAASVYLVYDFCTTIAAGRETMTPEVIKNYGLYFFITGTLPFLGIINAGSRMNWKIRAFFDLSYAAYCRRSMGFFTVMSLPLWLPFWALCLIMPAGTVLLLPIFLLGALVFMVNMVLSMTNGLLKFLLCMGFIVFAAYCYYTRPLLGLVLLVPAAVSVFRGSQDVYDWGSYDYML